METFWWVVVVVAGSLLTLIGWFRFIDHDGRVQRKPRYVELPDDGENLKEVDHHRVELQAADPTER